MKKIFVLAGLLMAVVMFAAGCGETRYDETAYYSPNWTPEGLIYSRKAVTHHVRKPGGLGLGYVTETLGTDYYYVTMDIDGNNEVTLSYSSYPYFSPKGTYAALISKETISIYKRSDNSKVYAFSPTTESISQLDWGPEEDKLTFLVSPSRYLGIVNVDGAEIKIINNNVTAAEITWGYGIRIAFFNRIDSHYYLSFISPDGSSLETTSMAGSTIGSYPDYYFDGGHLLSFGSDKFYKININSITIESEIVHNLSTLSPKIWINPKLSPDNQKVVGGFSMTNGIWLINTDGSGLKQLK